MLLGLRPGPYSSTSKSKACELLSARTTRPESSYASRDDCPVLRWRRIAEVGDALVGASYSITADSAPLRSSATGSPSLFVRTNVVVPSGFLISIVRPEGAAL